VTTRFSGVVFTPEAPCHARATLPTLDLRSMNMSNVGHL
jgi:hypothetical protein